MRKPLRFHKTWLVALAITVIALGTLISVLVFATGDSRLTATAYSDVIRFEAQGVASLRVRVYDLSGKEVWDSGVMLGDSVDWDRRNEFGERLAYGAYLYSAQGWSTSGDSIFQKNGKLALMPGDKVQLQSAPLVGLPQSDDISLPSLTTVQPLSYSTTGYIEAIDSGSGRSIALVAGPSNQQITTSAGNINLTPASGMVRMTKAGTNSMFQLDDSSQAPKIVLTAAGTSYLNGGNVGIGTTNATDKLTIEGSSGNLIACYPGTSRMAGAAVFRVEADGDVYADGIVYADDFQSGGADVAERMNTSEWVEAGDVVEIDPDHVEFFRKASGLYSQRVAGIVSTSPGVILGNDIAPDIDKWDDNRPLLAIAGRVPVKVSTENGPIAVGDLLVSSSVPGVAMKGDPAVSIGAVVGKAMEPLKSGEGTIMAQVTLR